ncbi:NAD-dependent epimerase/dehydratase family protein [bacterium]|nr:NAD-dependent epimerase/dehydratase family protein [bacterium]
MAKQTKKVVGTKAVEKLLITGGAGFIGHHIVQYFLEETNWDIVILDRLDVSGTLNRLTDLPNWEAQKSRVKFVYHDFRAPLNEYVTTRLGEVNYILHLAASTHVDRSISDPMLFVEDNVVGTTNMLQYARTLKNLKAFINFSTDEVFGPAPVGVSHKEDAPYIPSNPYSASKAGAASMGIAFFITYGVPVITTYTMNNFGERQHPEKLIPRTIRSVIKGETMPIFAELNSKGKLQGVGSRFWLHARNTASAVHFLLQKGKAGEAYNIIGFDELTNLEIAQKVAQFVGKPLKYKFVDFHKMRPGHDRRYALDGTKLKELGWKPLVDFETSLKQTIDFALEHPEWI